jgi:alkylation response protein AidB-like acyl-CoA dehydrogenase
MLLGIAEATQELATEYARRREQFGRPIGAFQAVKHLCADMFVRQELARAAVWAAGATLDLPEVGNPERAVAAAKLLAGEAAARNARACLQVHGGMGFTWELPVHYYLKRAAVLESLFGTGEEHALRIAAGLAAAPQAEV